MPPLQTTYSATMKPAIAGMVANMEISNTISRQIETAAGIGFGVVVVQGADDNGVRLPDASHLAFRGITVLDPTRDPQNGDKYAQYDTAAVLTRGVIWVTVGAAVAAGDPAYFVPATGVITNVATSNTAIPDGIFDSSAASGGLAKLRLN